MTEMTRTFGLELLESVLTNFSSVFFQHPEFSFLLKERVCALVIKLFSPNIKYRSSVPASVQQATPLDKPYFPISMRLLRVVSILIQKYHSLLVTECEIFLSLIVKFLDPDKPPWQRSLALEVLHKMTVLPDLLKSFCECYDLKPHSTNIFQDIVNSLGAYVQSLFVNPQLMGQGTTVGGQVPTAQGQPPSLLAGMPVGPGVSPQPGFFSRGVWFPIVITYSSGQTKSIYLDMLEKGEPPAIPDGYGISVAYACLLETIRSISITIDGLPPAGEENDNDNDPAVVEKPSWPAHSATEEERRLHAQLINSSWCGLLAALSPLVDASTDESASENVLKAVQTFASLCGALDLQVPRDAFITAICKASLPPHYALTVLNAAHQHQGTAPTGRAQELPAPQYSHHYTSEADYRQQVVAVGTPLPTSSVPIGVQQGPVMLTAKNLQCMRALLSLAHCHGGILGTAWHLVLTTLQHLVWILGLKPATGGSLKAGRTTADSNAVITTAVMADLPVLSQMLSRLFESSQYLDDVALHHLVDALCKLSHEAMELAYSNREPSLFAVAKLLETGLVNLPRVEVLWRPLTNHLLEVCQHPHIRMREWGVEAITYLVRAALQHKHTPPLRDNQRLQTLLLGPLSELSGVPHGDVRQRQLECVLHALHGAGETLSHGWPLVLGIIGAVSDHHGENLIRVAFQCLQLVMTDFLPVMPWRCLPQCMATAAKFGSQTQELNISLTAVGLMWNISDFFYQNQEKLCSSLSGDANVFPEFPGTPNMPPFDKLWMCLFARLGDLCVDARPAVRKSAGQTLFSTISAHGGLLQPATWQPVLWQVLFPLLDKVRSLSGAASSEKVDTGGNILIHHSRNTAQKQWAETQVLTLSGVARIFNTKCALLLSLGDFPRAWSLLLEFIEHSALNKNNEVSLAALKAFQEVLYVNKQGGSNANKGEDGGKAEDSGSSNTISEEAGVWSVAWRVWLSIGTESTAPSTSPTTDDAYVPSQAFLTALIQIFPAVFAHVRADFGPDDLERLCVVLQHMVSVPVQADASMFLLSGTSSSAASDAALSPLQEGVVHCVRLLQEHALTSLAADPTTPDSPSAAMVTALFRQLLWFSRLACQRDAPPNFVPFGEKMLSLVVSLYEETAEEAAVVEGGVLQQLVEALRVPLSLKYRCPSPSTWQLGVTCLLAVLHRGLPLARRPGRRQHYEGMWPALADTLDHFLFPQDPSPNEDIQADEAVDCQVIELVRDEVLPYSTHVPKEFVLRVVVLLNKGSIHSATANSSLAHACSAAGPGAADAEAELKLREEFAKTCFETLLQFSLLDGVEAELVRDTEGGLAGRLAVTALLHRFQDVLCRYVEDERQSGSCPLPRYRLSEISFVLKAVATLVMSLKKAHAHPGKVDRLSWEQLIGLYPHLVNCTTTASAQVSRSLREALLQYRDLLQPPAPSPAPAPNTHSSLTNGV